MLWYIENYPKTSFFIFLCFSIVIATVAIPSAIFIRYVTYIRLYIRQKTRRESIVKKNDIEESDDDSEEEDVPPNTPPTRKVTYSFDD